MYKLTGAITLLLKEENVTLAKLEEEIVTPMSTPYSIRYHSWHLTLNFLNLSTLLHNIQRINAKVNMIILIFELSLLELSNFLIAKLVVDALTLGRFRPIDFMISCLSRIGKTVESLAT
jgi:hypothetical protein